MGSEFPKTLDTDRDVRPFFQIQIMDSPKFIYLIPIFLMSSIALRSRSNYFRSARVFYLLYQYVWYEKIRRGLDEGI